MSGVDWAAELFPQHRKSSGAAAVLKAADEAAAAIERGRNTRVCDIVDELDRLDREDQHEHGADW